jgi:hypothetical protein
LVDHSTKEDGGQEADKVTGYTAVGRIPRLEDEKPADELNTEELKGVVGGAEVPINTIATTLETSGGLLTQQQLQQIVSSTINAINQQNKQPT